MSYALCPHRAFPVHDDVHDEEVVIGGHLLVEAAPQAGKGLAYVRQEVVRRHVVRSAASQTASVCARKDLDRSSRFAYPIYRYNYICNCYSLR